MRSEELGETLLPKRLALPIFASDPLSSVAYATQEILLVLTVGGTAFLYLTPWVAACVVALMVITAVTPTNITMAVIPIAAMVVAAFFDFGRWKVRHWNRLLRTEQAPAIRGAAHRARIINRFGAVTTALVLVIVLLTKFTQGAWLAVVAALLLRLMMRGIRRHYDAVAAELAVDDLHAESVRPSKVHGIVLVAKLHKPTLRALGYAQAFRPDTLEALSVAVEKDAVDALKEQWAAFDVRVPLKVLDSPYREITKPVVGYVREYRRANPQEAVAVFIPEYVVGHWWEHLLHNQSALWLKSRLLFTPGVMVISVPWQLSSAPKADHPVRRAPGAVRRGEPAANVDNLPRTGG
ncbi:hypothetical protein OG689_07370 [Kitasatospora sp. NBC_00240]|uniref:hypothetical protein n=1 Tax=Kitasatospora sp. NBC_00240 TaxID=2903567 RepID=UPI00224F8354|nr:hypothetical protein [Kitasatospora sp. NBC_00240]MCX5209106.1 hypothetical protein [Kitasatospora sp. NBC_00240]